MRSDSKLRCIRLETCKGTKAHWCWSTGPPEFDCVGTATEAAAQNFSTYYNVQKAAYLQKGSAGAIEASQPSPALT